MNIVPCSSTFCKGVARGFAFIGRDKNADIAFADHVVIHRTVFFEGVVDDAIAFGHREEVADESEQATRRNHVVQAGDAIVGGHVAEDGSTIAQNRHHIADEFIRGHRSEDPRTVRT
jgi:hypothetical protein